MRVIQVLLPIVRKQFPSHSLQLGTPPGPSIIIPARHPLVGDVSIWDEDDEIVVSIGNITHGHFALYEPLDEYEKAQAVSEQVTEFLQMLLSDNVLLWKVPSNNSGGWYERNPSYPFRHQLPDTTQYFLWSGPQSLTTILAHFAAQNKIS